MKVTLDDIRAAAERKYGDYEVDLGQDRVLVLSNPLRLPKAKRKDLFALIDKVQADDTGPDADEDRPSQADEIEGQLGAVRDILRLIADRAEYAEELITAIGDDLPMLMEIFEGYMGVAQPGEALNSEG